MYIHTNQYIYICTYTYTYILELVVDVGEVLVGEADLLLLTVLLSLSLLL